METIQREAIISFPMLGNFSINPPSYFTVLGKNIYFYAVLIAVGFLLGIWYCTRHSKDFGITEDDFYDTVLWLIPISIIGARLYFVAFRLEEYLTNPAKIIAVWEGGLAIYGGVIAGMLVIILACRKKKIPVAAMLDLFIFGLLIGQILGRWGNFMNREAFGAETEIFCRMGLTAPSGNTIYVHPTFLYESLWNLICLIFLIVWTKKGKRRYDGQCALIYFFWYGIGRAWIEGLRTDSLYIGNTGIRVSQVLSMALVLISAVILLIQSRREHPEEKLFVNAVKAAENENKEEAEKKESDKTEESKMADYKDIIAGTLNVIAGKVKEAVNTVSESMGENGSVREVYEAGAGRAKAYARMARLSLELNGEREELKRVYTEIGKLYYDAAKDAPEGFFSALFAQVDEINARIQAKNDELDEIKAEAAPSDIDVEISEFDDVVSENENDVTGSDKE